MATAGLSAFKAAMPQMLDIAADVPYASPAIIEYTSRPVMVAVSLRLTHSVKPDGQVSMPGGGTQESRVSTSNNASIVKAMLFEEIFASCPDVPGARILSTAIKATLQYALC